MQHPNLISENPIVRSKSETSNASVSVMYRPTERSVSRSSWHPTCRLPALAMEQQHRVTVGSVQPLVQWTLKSIFTSVPLRPLFRARIGAATRVAWIRASTFCWISSRDTARRAHSSHSDGSRITIRGSYVGLHEQVMRSLRTGTGTGASIHWRPKNSDRISVHRRLCSKMSAVPPSGDSARPTFRSDPDASGPSMCFSKKDSVTIPACSPFAVQDTDTVRRQSCRTRCIACREHCASCRWPRPRGEAHAFRLPAARTSATCPSASFVTASVNIHFPAFPPRSTCTHGSWILISRVSPSDGSRKRAITVASRARVRAWSSCSRSSASPPRRDV